MDWLYARLCGLSVYKGLTKLPAADRLLTLLRDMGQPGAAGEVLIDRYTDVFSALVEEGDRDFGTYLKRYMRYDENPFARACAENRADDILLEAARHDIGHLNALVTLGAAPVKERLLRAVPEALRGVVRDLPEWRAGTPLELDELADGYRYDGCGLFARGRAFIWERGGLTPVRHPDTISQADMVGYDWQRREVVDNTRALIEGRLAANVLLHGDSGTGKSATVKSLLQVPEFFNLRLIEISRGGLEDMHALIQMLVDRSQKFILFIDDLSFSSEDRIFSALKSILEGGLGRRPQNVVVYATSNRRHMVRETFSDRAGDDVHVAETIQEKTSLADRFGIRIPYLSLNRAEYLETVDALAGARGIVMDRAALHAEASAWEIGHGGRTPRVARQFVDYLASMSAARQRE